MLDCNKYNPLQDWNFLNLVSNIIMKVAGNDKGATTFSITTLSIIVLFVTLSIKTLGISINCHCPECCYAECHVLLLLLLNVIMVNVVIRMSWRRDKPILLFYRVITSIKSFKVQINNVYIKNIFVRHWCWGLLSALSNICKC